MALQVQAAEQALMLLNEQADGLRAEVSVLREVQRGLSDGSGDLVQVNEKLVLAALRADVVAETAVKDLQALVLSGQHDALTGTPNRTLMMDRLESAIAQARRDGTHIAVLFLDLDRFKAINDRLGHPAGDEVLKLVARRLESVVREADTVSRHSGDEFVVLLAHIVEPFDAGLVAAKMLVALAVAARIDEQPLFLSASIGIALYPEDGQDAASLIGRADAAMYRSKRRAPGRFEFCRTETVGDDDTIRGMPSQAPVGGSAVDLAREHHLQNLRDVNERLMIAAMTAQEAEEQVEATHRRQITFLGTVAHELRNPLTPILQAAELMCRPTTDDLRQVRLQGVIKRQVAYMVRLIDDLLDGSRISTGKFRLQRGTVDLANVLANAVDTCRPAMTQRLQRFTMGAMSGPIHLHGDAVRLTQVFINLLDNASKYTPKGGVISLLTETLDGDVVVTVLDNGVGITEEALPRIFDLFVQDAHALEIHNGGLGIGLAVVRELVEAHGGTVIARSAGRGHGSRFVVTLPIEDAAELSVLPSP